MNEVAILERSVGYALGCLAEVAGTPSGAPTPCRDWNLQDLLEHLADTGEVLAEAVGGGISPPGRQDDDVPGPDGGPARLAAAVGARARQTLGEWIVAGVAHDVRIGGLVLPARTVVALGAVELAVHGWDVARACGRHRPLPAALAGELLAITAELLSDPDRPGRFDPPLPGPFSRPDAALLGFLGRSPGVLADGGQGRGRM